MTTVHKFSFRKFLFGFGAGVLTIALLTFLSQFLWGDRFLEAINNLYLKF